MSNHYKFHKYMIKNNFLQKSTKMMGGYQFYVKMLQKSHQIYTDETDTFDKTIDKIIDIIISKIGGNINKEVLLNNFDFYYGIKKLSYDKLKDKNIADVISPNGNLSIEIKKFKHQEFDEVGFNIMHKLIEHLILNYRNNIYDKIIISKFSYNVGGNDNITDVKKNITQQFQYINIDDNLQNICIVLYDQTFFEPEDLTQNQFYDLINVRESDIDFIEDNHANMRIKKFIKEKNLDFENSRLIPNQYSTLYINTLNELVGDRFKNKKITWFIVKCQENENFVNRIIKNICRESNVDPNIIFKVCFFNGECELL
jgi:hypothetical protein